VEEALLDCKTFKLRQLGITAHDRAGEIVNTQRENPEWVTTTSEGSLEAMRAICSLASESARRRSSAVTKAESTGPQLSSTGSAFPITRTGMLLTNYHVVKGCDEVRIRLGSSVVGSVRVVTSDETNDLALLKANTTFAQVVALRSGTNIRPADDVVAVGFPLAGLLADQPNVTTGTVSALAGLGNDSRYLQISSPVQPGNSGGPLFDLSGHLVGVVTETLDALVMAKEGGTIPQNVNFALTSSVVRGFLDAYSISYGTARSDSVLSKATVAERGRAMTFRVDCWTNK
jgi:S1-C subfamily serine protease